VFTARYGLIPYVKILRLVFKRLKSLIKPRYITILELYAKFWWGNLRERDHSEDPDVDARLVLRLILRK